MTTWTPEMIAELRNQLGVTQVVFARRLGVDAATVSRWETGRHPVARWNAKKLNRLAKRIQKGDQT